MTPTAHTSNGLLEFRKGWKILAISLFGILASAGVAPLYSFGVLVTDMSEALGRTPGELQRCITFNFIGMALGSQVVGWLIVRYGVRPVVLISQLLLAALFAMAAFIPLKLWLVYLFYFLFPLIGCGTLQVSWTQITCQWFEKHRGMALAIILTGTGFSSIFLPILLTLTPRLGDWQMGYLLLSLMPLISTALCYKWLYEPRTTVAGTSAAQVSEGTSFSPGYSFKESFRTYRFWVICLGLVLVVAGILAMITNLVPFLRVKGMSAGEAAGVYSGFGVSLIVGRMVVGYLLDRIWAPVIAFISLFLPAIGCFILISLPANGSMMLLAAILIGIGAGAEYDIASYIITRYFGLREYSKIFGTMMGITTAVICLAPLYYGYMIDRFGGYTELTASCIGFFVVGSSLFLTLGRYPYFKTSSTASTKP